MYESPNKKLPAKKLNVLKSFRFFSLNRHVIDEEQRKKFIRKYVVYL